MIHQQNYINVLVNGLYASQNMASITNIEMLWERLLYYAMRETEAVGVILLKTKNNKWELRGGIKPGWNFPSLNPKVRPYQDFLRFRRPQAPRAIRQLQECFSSVFSEFRGAQMSLC